MVQHLSEKSSPGKCRRQQRLKRMKMNNMKGSRKGYYADIDDLPVHLHHLDLGQQEDDDDKTGCDTFTTSSSSSLSMPSRSSHVRFYSHIMPKSRIKNRARAAKMLHNFKVRAAAASTITSSHRTTSSSTSRAHPEIDLSLVALLSSEELDRRFSFPYINQLHPPNDESPSSSSSNSSSAAEGSNSNGNDGNGSSSSDTKVNDNIISKEKKRNNTCCGSLASSRPLAVMDYGSIELDMSGSLLDSIYKIGGGSSSSRSRSNKRSNNSLPFGGRRSLFTADPPKAKSSSDTNITMSTPYDPTTNTTTNVSASAGKDLRQMMDKLAEPRDSGPSSLCNPSSFTVASSRGPEVEAVIASLKNTAAPKALLSANNNQVAAKAFPMELQDHNKRRKIISKLPTRMMKRPALPTIDERNTNLEAAISFSPFARVLFCAQAPFTIVHSNAAYGSLVQKGLAKPCIVGSSFASNNEQQHPQQGGQVEVTIDSNSSTSPAEQCISRMVAEHIGALKRISDANDDNDDDDKSRTSRKVVQFGFVGSHHVHIFPVVSNDEMCSQLVRSYEKHHSQIQRMNSPDDDMSMANVSSHGMSSPAKFGGNMNLPRNTQYRSHYLLQIEPMSQLP